MTKLTNFVPIAARRMAKASLLTALSLLAASVLASDALAARVEIKGGAYVFNADGSGFRHIPKTGKRAYSMNWSNDGSKVISSTYSKAGLKALLITINIEGSERKSIPIKMIRFDFFLDLLLTNVIAQSPNVSKIAIASSGLLSKTNIYTMSTNGDNVKQIATGLKKLTAINDITWSPNSGGIAYSRCDDTCNIFTMKGNGTENKLVEKTGSGQPGHLMEVASFSVERSKRRIMESQY